MAEQSTVEVGNAVIVLTGINYPFSDGLTTGYLEFYDERHRPALPLTGRTLRDHITMVWNDPVAPSLRKAERITGWIEALMENAPQTFKSFLAQERTVLQEV
jgi:hypothetical protein